MQLHETITHARTRFQISVLVFLVLFNVGIVACPTSVYNGVIGVFSDVKTLAALGSMAPPTLPFVIRKVALACARTNTRVLAVAGVPFMVDMGGAGGGALSGCLGSP